MSIHFAARRAPSALLLAAGFAAIAGCAVNPATGERELSLISEEQEIAMGSEASQQVAQSIGLVEDEQLQRYVEEIGLSLAAMSERPELPWEFGVVDDPTPNAFALPGGYIYVTRGLATLLSSEAELAAVIGHEIGHVTARHSVSQLSRAQLAQLGLGLGMILSPEVAQYGDLIGTGVQLLFLQYGREDEREADELGFRYMLDGGYQVNEMANVFSVLLAAGEQAGQSALPTWLASHPTETERIESAERRVGELGQVPGDLRVGRDRHLDVLDGVVYGPNPRNGFFRDDWFYHPDLAFRFRVPADWQRQNLTSAVQAVSPEQDAAIELSIVPVAGAAEAAEAFLAEQSVSPIGSTRRSLDGRQAVISEFQAQGQGGTVRGYAAHIDHRDAVYQLVAYSPEPVFGRRAGFLEELVTSFSGVDDPQILDVQPRRIDIVEVPRAMTLNEFVEENPSAVPVEELALINHLAGAEAQVAAGSRLKRVVEE